MWLMHCDCHTSMVTLVSRMDTSIVVLNHNMKQTLRLSHRMIKHSIHHMKTSGIIQYTCTCRWQSSKAKLQSDSFQKINEEMSWKQVFLSTDWVDLTMKLGCEFFKIRTRCFMHNVFTFIFESCPKKATTEIRRHKKL